MQMNERVRTSASPRETIRIVVLVLVGAALLASGFVAGLTTMWLLRPSLEGFVAGLSPEGAVAPTVEAQISPRDRSEILWEIWGILEREYMDPEALDAQKMIHGAAAGLVSAVGDPPTVFVEPSSAAIMNQDMQGSFEGIGATVDMVEGRLLIVRPLDDSPAARAGLRAGDVVLAVDGQPLEGKTLTEAISMIRGPRGTIVRLLIEREGTAEPFVVPVTRDKVELPIIEARTLEGNVAYLRLTEFNAVSPDRVREALRNLLADDPVGLVFDLRGNPGGYLQAAVDVASEFLPRRTLILTEEQRDKPTQEFRVSARGVATDIPMVVLIDGRSASASEIVAGAIQDSGRGILIGTKTYGKGSVQNSHNLQDGSSLRVTVAKWYLPGGRNLEANGLDPDIEVARTPEDLAADRDPPLEAARQHLLARENVVDA